MKQGRIVVEAGKPLQFLDAVDTELPGSSDLKNAKLIGDALKAYRAAAEDLLKGKYAYLTNLAPRQLREPCDIIVLRCSDGVFVRYDATIDDKPRIRVSAMNSSLREMAPSFSDRILYLDVDPKDLDQDEAGIKLQMEVRDANGATTRADTLTFLILGTSQLPDEFEIPGPPARPVCLVSIKSEIDLQFEGYLVPVDAQRPGSSDQENFIARSRMQLAVGWLAIEIYPLLGDQYWQPQSAPIWAELDILATAAQRNWHETQLNALDSRGELRRSYATLLDEFEGLLQGPEEPVHQFLRQHPLLICPTCENYWSKLPFGSKVSDFVFLEPYNDYELVELEAPIRPLFRKDGQQREELTHAVNQIADWLSYIEDNRKAVQEDLGLTGISTSPRTLIVIGRSDSLTDDNRRKLTTLQNQNGKLRILTYDDMLEAARANLERILGPLSMRGENVRFYFYS
jgi:hypothetical protein